MRGNKTPKYIMIFEDLKNKINNGKYPDNFKLPSKRDLAIDLNVSINTVINAYNLLLDEGYIYAKEKVGYFVSAQPEIKAKIGKAKINQPPKLKYPYDFTTKSVDGFSDTTWKRVIKEAMLDNEYLERQDIEGLYMLRFEIANHLRCNRGIEAPIDNIIIGSGIEMLEGVLRAINIDNITLENPGYHRLKGIGENINKKINYIDIDNNGCLVPDYRTILYTTPFNQFPTGNKMSIARKKEMISYLNKTDSYLIEDDFDAEFRINQSPTTALYSFDNERVIFFSTFSTTMFPGLRIAYAIIPSKILDSYKKLYKGYSSAPAALIQKALGLFIEEGLYASLLNKRKKLYLEKRRIAMNALKESNIKFDEKANYLSILIDIEKEVNKELLIKLRENGINISSLSSYDSLNRASSILILGYTGIDKLKINEGITIMKKIIDAS